MSELDEAIGEISEEDNRKEEREKNYKDILRSITKDAFKDYDKDTWPFFLMKPVIQHHPHLTHIPLFSYSSLIT
jgi:hypothetical protein